MVLFAWLLLLPNIAFSNDLGFDVVTMRNGDIHHGTVAIEYLKIKTSFGEISVPYHQLLSLRLKTAKKAIQTAQLITREGEYINGQFNHKELTMFRVVDVTLPLASSDIARISFASRGIPSSPERLSPDIVKTNMGDQLLATLLENDFTLQVNTLSKTIPYQNIHSIDSVLTEEDDQPRVQVTLHNGDIFQGITSIKQVKFKTHYGQDLSLPLNDLFELRYHVNTLEEETDFLHRWQSKPKTLFRDRMVNGTLAPEMIIIPKGSYMRGDPVGDDDEKPTTSVNIKSFAIAVFEVTFDEYDLFCEDTRREKPDDADWGRGKRPVINVTWEDAQAYIKWLSARTRQSYRLPSDSEWEYAARANTQSKYWWGDTLKTAKANCEGCLSLWDGYQTAPVGKFFANTFGLHDTAGNVFEWVADCWHNKFSEAPNDGSPIIKEGCGKRVIRGGAWSFPPKEIRSANRWRDFPSRRSDDTGFRVAKSLPEN